MREELTSCRVTFQHFETQRHRTALHRYATYLLILSAIHVPYLPGHPSGYDVVCDEQTIDERRLAVILESSQPQNLCCPALPTHRRAR